MSAPEGVRSRCAAIVGPYLSGKTTLLESVLAACEAIPRKGSVKEHNTVGDASPEARERGMSTEINVAECTFLGDRWSFLDCPGSVELVQDTLHACMVADMAVVVCEADPARAQALMPLLHFLDERRIPHMLFVNKLDTASTSIAEVMEALQAVSTRKLVLRQIPIREGETITGYVDLVSERAYRYQKGKPSDLIAIPDGSMEVERQARQTMLETLADFDDALLEQLLEEAVPDKHEIYRHLANDIAQNLVVPVLLGEAEHDGGVRRLLKALRHDTPAVDATRAERGIDAADEPVLQVFRTVHAAHAGRLSLARVWKGTLREGATLGGERLGSLVKVFGGRLEKATAVEAGEVVGLAKTETLATGDVVSPTGRARAPDWPAAMPPLQAVALHAVNRTDEVKLSGALQRLVEEDPSYSIEHRAETHQLLLWGQGEQHLQIAIARLQKRFNVPVTAERPETPYRETIRRATTHHARFKRQTGGHGQFGDVVLDIRPLGRGEGFAFSEKVVGGAVPRNYFPAVEAGVREAMERGPLGFPVVDVAATLTDGKHHPVDSSEQAFRTAGRIGMSEGLAACEPVLLEPILKVTVQVPTEFTASVQRLLTGRRGQILGFDAREGWPGWDEVQAYLPQSEMDDMIVELRSLTQGVGTFVWSFDHLQELTGRHADEVVRARTEAAQ